MKLSDVVQLHSGEVGCSGGLVAGDQVAHFSDGVHNAQNCVETFREEEAGDEIHGHFLPWAIVDQERFERTKWEWQAGLA